MLHKDNCTHNGIPLTAHKLKLAASARLMMRSNFENKHLGSKTARGINGVGKSKAGTPSIDVLTEPEDIQAPVALIKSYFASLLSLPSPSQLSVIAHACGIMCVRKTENGGGEEDDDQFPTFQFFRERLFVT